MKCIGEYQNGNYTVKIYDDGTKIRENNLDFFESAFPENIDIKITNRCNIGCKMCHECSTPTGENADLLGLPFIDSLHSYTELAIGGGNIFENPQLIPFLLKLKKNHIIANITINQLHFEENYSLVRYLISEKLVYGVGVSLSIPSDKFVAMFKSCGQNMVLHVINGIVTQWQIERYLANHGLKILFLGYKNFGRGSEYWKTHSLDIVRNQEYIKKNMENLLSSFRVVSFDNLGIEQIQPRRFLTDKQFNEFYMGDEGQFTMYIDAVKQEFGKNSISTVRYPLSDNIDTMFMTIKKEA